MNTLALAVSLAAAPLLLLGAPASFDVTTVEVHAAVTGDTALVRVSWDLDVTDPGCGFLQGEMARLPAAAADRRVVLRLDDRVVEGTFEEADGMWRVGMDYRAGRVLESLRDAKRARLEMEFRAVPVKDGRIDLPLEALRPAWRRAKGDPAAASLAVRLVRRSGEEECRMEASFAKAAPGSVLRLTAGDGGIGVRLTAPAKKAAEKVAGR